jgi:uncharacterized OB-fold protein
VLTRSFNQAGFEQYLAEGRLMGTRCLDCGRLALPPRPLCPACHSNNLEWYRFSGNGTLIGHSTIFVGLPEMAGAGYDRDHPYGVAVVRLDEGALVAGRMADPETAAVGAPVRAVFIPRPGGEARKWLAFERRL